MEPSTGLQDAVRTSRSALGVMGAFPQPQAPAGPAVVDIGQNPAPGPTTIDQSDARLKREDTTSTGDYGSAMWDEDNLTGAVVRHFVGSSMEPDPTYTPFEKKEWGGLTEGVWPEYHKELYNAKSAAQALYIKGELMDKQANLLKLQDLGWKGNLGRLALGLVDPANLAVGEAGGWATKGYRAVKGIQGLRAAEAISAGGDSLVLAEARQGAVAAAAKDSASAGSVASGLATGAATNVAFEKVHQAVNFEDDSSALLTAALAGAVMTVPFVGADFMHAKRVSATAGEDLRAIMSLRDAYEGRAVAPADQLHVTARVAASDHAQLVTEGHPEADVGGFLHGSVGSAQVGEVSSIASDPTRMASMSVLGRNFQTRWDFSALLNKSTNPVIQKMGFMFAKDPIGIDAHIAQPATAGELKANLKRSVTGALHAELRGALDEAIQSANVPFFQRGAFEKDFMHKVTLATRGDASVLADNPEIASAIQRGSKAQRTMFDRYIAEAKKSGVEGADTINPSDAYVNRIWSHNRIREVMATHGADAVYAGVARAIRVPGLVGDVDKATGFMKAVMKLEFSPALQNVHLVARDMKTLREELAHYGLQDHEINAVADTMFETHAKLGGADPDAGKMGNLKHRFDIDENMKIQTDKGSFKISDLFENDARVLADVYGNSMAGHIGMAQKGITSKAKWNEMMRMADESHDPTTTDSMKLNREKQWLQDIYHHTVGAPMSTQDYSTLNRGASMFRAYARSVTLGQLGLFAALLETKQALAMTSMRAMTAHSPTLAGLFKTIREGRFQDKELARNVEQMVGFGYEKIAAHAREREISDGFYDKAFTGAENATNKLSHAIDTYSGNASVTALTRQWASMAFIQHHYDLATGRKAMTESKGTRLVHQGVDRDMQDAVLGHLKDYSEAGPDGLVTRVRHEQWSRENPETYGLYQTMLSRETRDAIQDHDIGETMPFMHSTLGKVFAELKNFMLVGHAKNFLKNLSYHDQTTAQLYLITMVGESLSYAMQTGLNDAHDPAKLAKKLDPDTIAKAAFFRSAALGFLPMMVDMGYGAVTGGESLVSPGTTANTDSRSFLNTPSLQLGKRLLSAPMTGIGMLTGATTTKQEMHDMLTTLPFSNWYGSRNLVDYMSSMHPKVDPAHPFAR